MWHTARVVTTPASKVWNAQSVVETLQITRVGALVVIGALSIFIAPIQRKNEVLKFVAGRLFCCQLLQLRGSIFFSRYKCYRVKPLWAKFVILSYLNCSDASRFFTFLSMSSSGTSTVLLVLCTRILCAFQILSIYLFKSCLEQIYLVNWYVKIFGFLFRSNVKWYFILHSFAV